MSVHAFNLEKEREEETNEVPLRGMKFALRANEAGLRPMKRAAHIVVALPAQSFEL